MTRTSYVLVVGDVMNDVVVRPLGPIAIGTDTPSEIVRSPGGSGANQAAWLAHLGVDVRFVGRVGAGDAQRHRDALEITGRVQAFLGEDDERPTGSVVALVTPDGERSMFTHRGANEGLGPDDVPSEMLHDVALLHVSGYVLFTPESRDAVGRLWDATRTAHLPTSVDPASVAHLLRVGVDEFLACTAGGDVVFPNLDEGFVLTGHREPDRMVDELLRHYAVVALKLGPAGALVASAGERLRVAARPAEVVDSTGSGDAFCAGFLASWLHGASLEVCAAAAVDAAAVALSRLGARP